MVYFFTSSVVDPPGEIYMGKDKHENEDLIKHGYEEDVWFHVDKLSSAHVYLRLPIGSDWKDIPEMLLNDLAQLTKANSIEGNKKSNVTIIYTPWSNLKKTGDMAVGQVTFHNPRLVKRVHVEKRVNEIMNRLNKTKREEYPDLYQIKLDQIKKKANKTAVNQKRQDEVRANREKYYAEQKELKSYTAVFKEERMKTNQYSDDVDVEDAEADFM
ncbi:hypothetical protein DSO57_1012315 [Entomophthora muscae]|uniref:Uncharacterized protein n=1 Tax=Entomophthora muscae TaxID=34485 RepID=A0ACC2U4N5_9FUNG|nr:hypothetical protein DSO57_1012315 [Entomophthora muscae]